MDRKRIEEILEKLNEDIYGKEEIIAVSFLGALAGVNTFLLGPPGTGKSLIARRIASVFESGNYFEFLMNKFSTPEEVFGPVKLSELKKDNYERQINGYLPTADVAFLDEIWKANSAILNSLLTIINEKKFKNGDSQPQDVPLKVLISASNEIPQAGQGLDALYDRFLIRLYVSPTEDVEQFNKIIQQPPASATAAISDKQKISNDDLDFCQLGIDEVKLSPETLHIISQIRLDIQDHNKEAKQANQIYVSDRRWQRAVRLLKANAFFCERIETNIADIFLLKYCLWSNNENIGKLSIIVTGSIRASSIKTEISYSHIEEQKDKLGKNVDKIFYYAKKTYITTRFQNKEYIHFRLQIKHRYHGNIGHIDIYIPLSDKGADGRHNPIDKNGNKLQGFYYSFHEQDSVTITSNNNDYIINEGLNTRSITLSPKVHDKGDVKFNEPPMFKHYYSETDSLIRDCNNAVKEIETHKKKLQENLYSPFIPRDASNIAIEAVDQQIERLRVVRTDIEQIRARIKKAQDEQVRDDD